MCCFPRELSDIDKDGRLSCDEYAIAMHLVSKVKGGASLPSSLPAELYPGPAKYYTVDRMASKAGKHSLEKKVREIISRVTICRVVNSVTTCTSCMSLGSRFNFCHTQIASWLRLLHLYGCVHKQS